MKPIHHYLVLPKQAILVWRKWDVWLTADSALGVGVLCGIAGIMWVSHSNPVQQLHYRYYQPLYSTPPKS
jgi:hypothetical protein